MAFDKDWKEVVMTDDDLKLLDTPYRDLSMDDRAKALSRVQKDYGDTVLTVVTQLLSTDVSLTMREAVMKETGSWPQWPEPKKRRGRSVKSGAMTSVTPTMEQQKTEKAAAEPSGPQSGEPDDGIADTSTEVTVDALSRGIRLCDKACAAAIELIRFAYVEDMDTVLNYASMMIGVAASCRKTLVDYGR